MEARYEVIERETVLALRKFDSGSLVGTSTGATQVSSSVAQEVGSSQKQKWSSYNLKKPVNFERIG